MDTVSSEVRSRMMQAVKGRDTSAEKAVRSRLHAAGYRFRLHYRRLPGRPDIVLPRYKIAVFVHGCFWHGHSCARGKRPSSNTAFWNAKIDGNMVRDRANIAALKAAGWKPVTIWQCSLQRDAQRLLALLSRRKRGISVSAK